MDLFVPMFLFAKVAVAALWVRVTTSLVSTPTSSADVFTRRPVAATVESYTRLFAVIPETVRFLAVIEAEADGWLSM